MTYGELSYKATKLYTKGKITICEYLEMTKPLNREIEQEPKTGRWIKSRDCYGNNHFTCPFCEHDIATKADTWGDNYCSNCGAKMESEAKE